jgi:hypothetical protein
VTFGLLDIREQSSRFDDDLHSQAAPWQLRGLFGTDHFDFIAVNYEDVILGLVGGGLCGSDFAIEAALGGIVFEKVSKIVSGHDIANSNDIDVFANEPLLGDGAKNQPANPSEPINCNFYSHTSISI